MKESIEVELKFILTSDQEKLLLTNSRFIKQIEFIDTYYDTNSYSLTTKDIWVRSRNGKFVLKYPLATSNILLKKQSNTPKQEIENEDEIRKMLSISKNSTLHNDLINAKILPLYSFKNIRRTYTKDGFIIDLDKAIFDDFVYETCEIELVVNNQNQIDEALNKITNFAKSHGLNVKKVEGRLIEYLRLKHPDHYKALNNK